jgi:hypothetical protein
VAEKASVPIVARKIRHGFGHNSPILGTPSAGVGNFPDGRFAGGPGPPPKRPLFADQKMNQYLPTRNAFAVGIENWGVKVVA